MMNSVSIVGSGNVATTIANVLVNGGVNIVDICSKSIQNAKILASNVGADAISDVKLLNPKIDLLIISVNDDAISDIISKLQIDAPVVHTSGSVDISILKGRENFGIIYPFQTFSKGRKIKIREVPFLIEANSQNFEEQLHNFVQKNISKTVERVNSTDRAKVHLAGVLASNFGIKLIEEAEKILNSIDVSLEILRPLVMESLNKAFEIGPKNAITGPAKRGDKAVVKKQMDSISNQKLQTIYGLMSDLIIENK